MTVNAKVAIEKAAHPERFCPMNRCLWRTSKLNHTTGVREGGGFCPRHRQHAEPQSATLNMVRNGFSFPASMAKP